MKPLISGIIIFAFCTNILSQKLKFNDELESTTYNCIIQKFKQINLDIEKELKGFEQYLLSNSYLTSSSVDEYRKLFQELGDKNNIPFDNTYEIKNLDTNSLLLLKDCFNTYPESSIKTNPLLYNQKKLIDAVIKPDNNTSITEQLKTILNQLDWTNSLHRLINQYNFYILTKPINTNPLNSINLHRNSGYYYLRITIDSNQFLHIDNDLVEIENLISKLQKKLTKEGIKDTSNVLVTLKIDPQVTLGFLAEVKGILFSLKLQKIIFI